MIILLTMSFSRVPSRERQVHCVHAGVAAATVHARQLWTVPPSCCDMRLEKYDIMNLSSGLSLYVSFSAKGSACDDAGSIKSSYLGRGMHTSDRKDSHAETYRRRCLLLASRQSLDCQRAPLARHPLLATVPFCYLLREPNWGGAGGATQIAHAAAIAPQVLHFALASDTMPPRYCGNSESQGVTTLTSVFQRLSYGT